MKELGDDAAGMHRAVGEAARDCGIDRLFVIGELSRNTVEGFGEHGSWYSNADALIDDLSTALSSSVNVLVKGSRSMRMEIIVEALRERAAVRKEA